MTHRRVFSRSECYPGLGYLDGANRHDVIVFPERLDDSSAADHRVRVSAAVVDALDLAVCGCHHAVPAVAGRPG